MRMRFKPYARPELVASPLYVEFPLLQKGKWHTAFKNPVLPLFLELGCGKGGFAASLAAKESNVNIVAVDITDKVLVLAKRSIEAAFSACDKSRENARVTSFDIERIDTAFDKTDNVSRIYINFCNPWNKKAGHKKHRLTHTKQLLKYREIQSDDGEIWFKCDHDGLFEDSIAYFNEAGYNIVWITRNLHENEPEWNIRTEHEEMYAKDGIKIKALIAKKVPI